MKLNSIRAGLLAATAINILAIPLAANAAEVAATEAAGGVESGDSAGDQSTSANQKGQANDKGALSTSDIIVTGSKQAEAAPITTSLTTTQPQAAVSRDFIDNSVASADFFTLIAMTPGVSNTSSGNGPGLSESKATIRGFKDGEYNVTYDSIPFADTNNPTHHSTAFFPSNTIETIVVDRGPGNASQLGQATYGGNINMYSRAVSDKRGGQIEGIAGSFNTYIARAEYQSGTIDSLGGAKFVVSGQYLSADGALTFSPVASKNLFAKAVIPIGTANTLTLMSTWNRNHYYQSDTAKGTTCGSLTKGAVVGGVTFSNAALGPDGAPLTQLTAENCAPTSLEGLYGKNYGLTDDPTQASYYKYNRTDKTTDFTIIRLQSTLAEGLTMDNRFYMYGYTNNTFSGNTAPVVSGFNTTTVPVSATNPNGKLIIAIPGPVTDVPGYNKLMKYRNLGYIGQINYDFSMGKIRVGAWYEHSRNDRHIYDFDWTKGGLSSPSYSEKFNNGSGLAAQNILPDPSVANIAYEQQSGWEQYELFGEFEFHPVEQLAITPGVKYVHFTRSINAAINQTSRTPNHSSATWTKTLPFLTVNWQVRNNWAFYAQYAQGMYVPDISSFYSASLTAADQTAQAQTLAKLQPQTSTNYQIGTVWHGEKVSVDFDAYSIVVNNKIAADPTIGTVGGAPAGSLVNIGQVKYKGVEGAVSVMPIAGLTIFGNASYNSAKSVTTGAQIASTPYYTAAAGLIYRHGGLRISYSQKFQGDQFAKEYDGNPNSRIYRIKGYSTGEFAASQEIGEHLRIGVTVSNVFNNRTFTSIGSSATGAPTAVINGVTYQTGYGQADTFNFLPPRSFQADIRFKF